MCLYNDNNVSLLCLCNDLQEGCYLNKDEVKAIKQESFNYENARSVSIEALKIVQKSRGWISDLAIQDISKILGVSVTDLEGVATFYNQIFRKPVNRHIIRYCDSVVCYMFRSEHIREYFEDVLNIGLGDSTSDGRFTLLPTCCLGKCDEAPVIMINDDIYTYITLDNINEILDKYI